MRNTKLLLSLIFLFVYTTSIIGQQQSSKSKSADKLYEKGEINNNVIIKNAGEINTNRLEFSPTFYQNGIVYIGNPKSGPRDKKINKPFFEFYYAELDGNNLPQSPDKFSMNLNSQRHEGPVSFNPDGSKIYFTRNNMKDGVTKADKKGLSNMKIYEATRGQFDWENAKELPFNSDNFTCFHPTLSHDGTVLYFSSNMPGGYGGMDLYMTEKRADTWSKPINLGKEINTSGNEAFPFIHPSGTLFFASNGHGGYGGLDLLMVEVSGRGATKVSNLGTPFNSVKDDFGFIIMENGSQGFLTSNRDGGEGEDDIYFFEAVQSIIESNPVPVSSQIIVFDKTNNRRLQDASIRVFERAGDGFLEGEDLYDIQLLPSGDDGDMVMKLIRKSPDKMGEPNIVTDETGEAIYQMKPNKSYMIIASKAGYESGEVLYSTEGVEGTGVIEIPLKSKSCVNISGIVSVEKIKTRIPNALIKIVNECTGAESILKTNSNGEFEACVPVGCNYTLYAEKEGYKKGLSKTSTNNLNVSQKLDVNVNLSPIADINSDPNSNPNSNPNIEATAKNKMLNEPIREGSVIVLKEIYYDFNKSAIRRGAARELDALVELMRQNPSIEIELISHTDARGDENYNLDLSLRRAESAKKYLMNNGIDDDRIKAFGYGEAQILNDCVNNVRCSDEEHQFNRRTEVKITRIDDPIKVRYENGSPNENGGRM